MIEGVEYLTNITCEMSEYTTGLLGSKIILLWSINTHYLVEWFEYLFSFSILQINKCLSIRLSCTKHSINFSSKGDPYAQIIIGIIK